MSPHTEDDAQEAAGHGGLAVLAESAFGYVLGADELAWFECEFQRTRALMDRVRAQMPELSRTAPESFDALLRSPEIGA